MAAPPVPQLEDLFFAARKNCSQLLFCRYRLKRTAQRTSPESPKPSGRRLTRDGLRTKVRLLRLGSIRVFACLLGFSAALPAQQYVFRAYRHAEGLKNLSVNALTRDREGFLWVATENGVYRFLGSRFEQFGREQGILEPDVQDVVADSTGTVWVGTSENLYRWDGQRFLAAGRDPIHIMGPQSVAIEDARHLLVVDKGWLYRLEHDDSGRMLSYLPVFPLRLVAVHPDLSHVHNVNVVNKRTSGSRVWIGCGKKLYTWLDGVVDNPGTPRDGAVTEWGGR